VITRKTKLKLLAFAALAVLGMSYLGFKYVGLDRALLGNGYEIAADFSDSGGIFVNAEVTYRGLAVGRVSDMKLVEDGVRVVLTIDPDTDPIPAGTSAIVATRSAVGEQYVDLRPDTDGGPFLEDGSTSMGWSARSTRRTSGSSSTSWARPSPVPGTTWAG
jgi:ABC-type transporter Mla subunit MlaD